MVRFLKWSPGGLARESAIYQFKAQHPDFPATKGTTILVSGEECLLLNRVEGKCLADVAKQESPGAYVAAARGMARLHHQASASDWTRQLTDLEILKDRLTLLPTSVLQDLQRRIDNGE